MSGLLATTLIEHYRLPKLFADLQSLRASGSLNIIQQYPVSGPCMQYCYGYIYVFYTFCFYPASVSQSVSQSVNNIEIPIRLLTYKCRNFIKENKTVEMAQS